MARISAREIALKVLTEYPGRAKPEDVTQVINYSKWVAGRLANSEIETVRPILIAFGFDEETITKARDSDFSDRGISLFQYEVKNSDLRFEKVSG